MSVAAEEAGVQNKKVFHLKPSYEDDHEPFGAPSLPPPPHHHPFQHGRHHHHPPPFFPRHVGPPPPFHGGISDDDTDMNTYPFPHAHPPPPHHLHAGMFVHPHFLRATALGGHYPPGGQFPPPAGPPRSWWEGLDDDGRGTNNDQDMIEINQVPYMRWEDDEKSITLAVDVAGFKAKDLEISVSNSKHLVIKGKRSNKYGDSFVLKRQAKLNIHIHDESAIEAKLEHDLLEITIPKLNTGQQNSRVIPIHFSNAMEEDPMEEAELVIVNNTDA